MRRILPICAVCLFGLIVAFLFFRSPTPILSASSSLVISEVQISGETDTDEFVELYNPTSSQIIMSGWRLRRKNSSGTEENLVAVLNGTIPTHGFFLIGHSSGYNESVPLDIPYSAPSNALKNNYAVLLYSDAGITLVDKVGFGTAADYESSPFPTNPPANQSIERISMQDTDNNADDFILRTVPDPQNSASVSATPTLTPTPTPTILPTLTPTPIPEPTPTPTEIPIQSPTPTPEPTATPTPEPTATPTPSVNETPTPTPVIFPTPTPYSEELIRVYFPRGIFICTIKHKPFLTLFGYFYIPFVRCGYL